MAGRRRQGLREARDRKAVVGLVVSEQRILGICLRRVRVQRHLGYAHLSVLRSELRNTRWMTLALPFENAGFPVRKEPTNGSYEDKRST